jgi:hypothetical protein
VQPSTQVSVQPIKADVEPGKRLTLKQKKDLELLNKRKQFEARRLAKLQRLTTQMMLSVKEELLENKMDD